MEDYIIYISAGAFLLLFFVIGYLARRSRHKKATAAKAADVFREKVLSELQGLYPIPRHLDSKEYERFRESIPGIEHAAAEFRHFLPSGKRDAFDNALNNYTGHCKEIRWVDSATFGIIPGEKSPEDEGPKEIFRQNVNALLAFAKKTD